MQVVTFLFLIFAASALLSAEANKKLESISVQLHWKYQFEFAGFIAAKEKGFYEEVGLDVKLKEYEHATDIVDEVLKGRANFGVYNSNILLDFLHDKPIVLLSSYFKRSALVLVTKPHIKTPRDLIGKTIMANGKKDFDINFKPFFKRHGIETDAFSFVEHTYDIKDFLDSKVDAMSAFISDQPYALDALGVPYNIINPSDFGTFNLQLELFTSKAELLAHPQRVKNFRDATIKGWEYALANQEEIIEIIYEKYSQAKTKDFLRNEATEVLKLILPYTYNIGSIDKNFLERQLELFKQDYNQVANKTIDEFLYKKPKKEFTKEEKEYLKFHTSIPLCLQHDQFPFDGYENKTHIGITADIFALLAKDLGVKFTPLPSQSHDELSEKLRNNSCSLLSFMPATSKHFENMRASEPFTASPFVLITKLDKSFVQNASQLKERTLFVEFAAYKEHLLRIYPFLRIEVEEDIDAMMQKVLSNEAFGCVTLDEKADYLINQVGYGKLKINGFLAKNDPMGLSIGVVQSDPILHSILNKALHNIPERAMQNIFQNWLLKRYEPKKDYSLVLEIFLASLLIVVLMYYYLRRLKSSNHELTSLLQEKTKELHKLNLFLELTVKEKVQELVQKDKLLTAQSKQAVMGEMIQMIAHQWRQPLSTITLQISNLQINQMLGKHIDEEQAQKTLSYISETIIYLSETIDDFQTYFSPDKEAIHMEVHEVLQKALTFALPRIKSENITLNVKRSADIYAEIYINELVQVILNMLNNAIDAFNTVEREHKEISLYVEHEGEKVKIYIEDNACGITEENIERLFEPYFSTKGRNGTGLGLYMSQMIIEKQFNGSIEVRSSPAGSTFIVSITQLLS